MDRFVRLVISEPIAYDLEEPPPVQGTFGTIEADLATGEVTLPGGFKTELRRLAEVVDELMLYARAFKNERTVFSPEIEYERWKRAMNALR